MSVKRPELYDGVEYGCTHIFQNGLCTKCSCPEAPDSVKEQVNVRND